MNPFSRVICRPTVAVAGKGGNRTFLNDLNAANLKQNMIVFPEGAVADSISGLMAFQRSVFRLEQPIYLVAIRYRRALPFLQGKALSKAMGIEVLVDLFQPWIKVELIALGQFQPEADSSAQQRAHMAQTLIAETLGLAATRWDKHDRHRLLFK